MGTEILRPQDCLIGRSRTSPVLFPRRKGCNYGNSYSNDRINFNPSPNPRPSRKQQQPLVRSEKLNHERRSAQPEPSVSRRSGSDDGRAGRIGLAVMEKVTVLRRGASLDSKMRSELPMKKERGNPDAKQLQASDARSTMMTRCDLYAGSAFAVSPEPSALPLPSFSKKKVVPFDDLATRDLRRLLRLD